MPFSSKSDISIWLNTVSSREYEGEKVILYPEYFDSTLTRKQGRRLSQKYCVSKPTVEEIFEAAEKLGLNPLIEDKHYPREWWRKRGRVVVDKKDHSKTAVLRSIGEELKRIREEKKSRR
jgi:signal recognition particle subunit SRP19